MTHELIVPSIRISPHIDGHLEEVEIDRLGTAEYLRERGLSDQRVSGASINLKTTPYSTQGEKVLGEYAGYGNINLHSPYIVVPKRGYVLPQARKIRELSVEERFNFVLYHEIEHYIDDVNGERDDMILSDEMLLVERLAHKRLMRLNTAIGLAAATGIALETNFLTAIDLYKYLETAVPAGLAGSLLYEKAKMLINRAAYYDYPQEVKANQAGFDGLKRARLIRAKPVKNPRRLLKPTVV